MKQYLIMKDFNGTQGDNQPPALFKTGQVTHLSDSLVSALGGVKGEYVKDAETAAEEISKAPPELASDVIAAITEAATEDFKSSTAAEERDTKVVEPEETKSKLTLRKK
jgi:hypothetical protein